MKSFVKKFMVACVLLPMSLGLGLSTTACTEDSITTTQSDGYSVIKQTDNYVLHKIVKKMISTLLIITNVENILPLFFIMMIIVYTVLIQMITQKLLKHIIMAT